MKVWQVGLSLMALSAIAVLPNKAIANGSDCSTRCETQYDTCHASAEDALTICLDRAEGKAHADAACAAAFTKLEDACRATESSCLSNCPAD